jgi:hypothetical protein
MGGAQRREIPITFAREMGGNADKQHQTRQRPGRGDHNRQKVAAAQDCNHQQQARKSVHLDFFLLNFGHSTKTDYSLVSAIDPTKSHNVKKINNVGKTNHHQLPNRTTKVIPIAAPTTSGTALAIKVLIKIANIVTFPYWC